MPKTLSLTLVLICLGSLSSCAAAHLPSEEPMNLISQVQKSPRAPNSMTSTMAATLLGLNANQKQLFEQYSATLRRQNSDFRSPVRNFQQSVRQMFVSNSFSASQLQSRWRQTAGPVEARMATESAIELLGFWKSLGPEQRQKIDTQLGTLKTRWQTEAQITLASLRKKQEQRLRTVSSQIQANPSQQTALKNLLIDPRAAYERQMALRRRFEALYAHLRTNQATSSSVSAQMRPLYSNEAYLTPQLSKLQKLHAQLKPAQRQQLVSLLR